jgi:hypothetical protein
MFIVSFSFVSVASYVLTAMSLVSLSYRIIPYILVFGALDKRYLKSIDRVR